MYKGSLQSKRYRKSISSTNILEIDLLDRSKFYLKNIIKIINIKFSK